MEVPKDFPVKFLKCSKNVGNKCDNERGEDLEKLVVKSLDMKQEFLTTGCAKLDLVLRGGIPCFGITELFGESASGKTQLCLQLAITAQLGKVDNGLDASVLYLCTEDALPSKRLHELSIIFKSVYKEKLSSANPMDNIYVEHLGDAQCLMECLENRLPTLVKRSPRKIRLLVLDSVAGIFRIPLDGDFKKRTLGLRKLGQALHEFSREHDAAVVVCNQVTANLQERGINNPNNIAALGLAWKNMITTRIRISKSENELFRYLEMEFSPLAPSIKIPIKIVRGGIQASDGPPGSGLHLF